MLNYTSAVVQAKDRMIFGIPLPNIRYHLLIFTVKIKSFYIRI